MSKCIHELNKTIDVRGAQQYFLTREKKSLLMLSMRIVHVVAHSWRRHGLWQEILTAWQVGMLHETVHWSIKRLFSKAQGVVMSASTCKSKLKHRFFHHNQQKQWSPVFRSAWNWICRYEVLPHPHAGSNLLRLCLIFFSIQRGQLAGRWIRSKAYNAHLQKDWDVCPSLGAQ